MILFSLPVALSFADTCRMPFASMSNVTSICGMPRGAGGMPSRLNWPRLLLPPARSRSPCSTWIVTAGWLSSAVENVCVALVGIVVFFWMSLVITPPSVSMPSDSGVTSSSSTSLRSPASTDAWIAAPTATASSGLTSLRGSLPKNCLTVSCTFGMRVWPPTRITSLMSSSLTPASLIAIRHGSTVRWIRSSTSDSSFARVIFIDRCFGPRLVGRDVRQVDVGLLRARQLDLRLFGGFLEPLQREHVVLEVDARFLPELVDDVFDDPLVEVLAAEERVAVGRQHLELVLAFDVRDFDDRDVERAAAEVVDGDLAVAFALVEAERERRRRRLVDDPLDFEARDAAGVLRRLALRVVEVRRHGDDRLGHFLAEVVLGRLLHLAQDFGRHLLRRDLLAAHLDPGVAVVGLDDPVGHQVDVLLHFLFLEAPADQALDREDRVLRRW